MKFISAALLFVFLFPNLSGTSRSAVSASSAPLFGFRNSSDEMAREIRFMVVPDPKLAEEHLRILTQAPHMAGTPEDKATADYVAQKFRDAGLETEIVEYRVWMNYPGRSQRGCHCSRRGDHAWPCSGAGKCRSLPG